MMKKSVFLLFVLLAMVSCQKTGKFHIVGNITDAQDTMLYLEHITLADGVVAIDSVRLGESGEFDLKGDTCSNPEFYRLRIGGQCINLGIDSTETVTVQASLKNMSFGYTVSGSGACDTIRQLSLKLAQLERDIVRVRDDRNYTIQERDQMIEKMVHDYKDDVKINYIQNHYGSTSSYFACFQALGYYMLFDPVRDKSDLVWLRAVANAWNDRYPGSLRTQNLANIVSRSKKNQSRPHEIVLDVNGEKVREIGIIDMTFPDAKGVERTLSDLRGKVVLLDFTAYALKGTRERTLLMREMYDKYHNRGLEIYQVSLDADRHFWVQQTEALPWVNVYCQDGINNDIVNLYQVNALPCYFLIDKDCNLVARMENIPDLEKAIQKEL